MVKTRTKSPIFKRVGVLFIYDIICSLPALWLLIKADIGLSAIAHAFFCLHLGPYILFTEYGQGGAGLLWQVTVVVTNIICISAYLVRPNVLTGIISFLGIAGWLFLALFGIMMGI